MPGKPQPIEPRFWRSVSKTTDGCWEWQASLKNGYGVINYLGHAEYTHRISWMLAYGPIPEGQWVLHRCDNPKCVRPDHLFLGDRTDNIRDMVSKKRSWPQIHPDKLSGELNPAAVLTRDQVLTIRALLTAGGITQAELATRYSVCRATISHIANGRNWSVNRADG